MKNSKKDFVSHPLMCWDIVLQQRVGYQLQKLHPVLFELQRVHEWTVNLPALLDCPVDALVVTNTKHEIIWADDGFQQMTGYEPDEFIGRRPSFLQGEGTRVEAREHIRKYLTAQQPVSATLTNYKKNGTPYYCTIDITPLFNQFGMLVNFIALEKEIEHNHDERTSRKINHARV